MKPTPRPINKAIISVGFGIIAFYLNFHAISFSEFPQFKISILMGLLFPLIITLAWGWRYGLLSALAGGCQSMWWLWQSDGYGIFYSVPVFILWIVWHGAWSAYRKRHKSTKWFHSMYAVELIFRIFCELGFYTVFRWLVSLNPPAWAPEITWTYVPYSWVHFVVIKHTISAYILLLLCHVLLSLGPVRRFFRLDSTPRQKNTTYIVSASILLGLFIWFFDSMIMYLTFYEGSKKFIEAMALDILPKDLFQKNLFLFVCLIAGLLISKLLSQKFEGERALRKSEKKYRNLLETTPEGCWQISPELKIVEVNPALCKMLGYSREEMIGKTPFDFTDDENQKNFIEQTSKISPTPHRSYEIVLKKKNGEDLQAYFNSTTIRDESGKVQGAFAFISDITKRKQIEEDLQQSERLLTNLFDSIQDGISVLNPDLTIVHVNQVMNQWYSKNLPLEGKKCYECYHNADKPCDPCPTLRCFESGKTEWNVVPGLAGSSIKWIELFSHPIKNKESGEITGVVEFVRDITEIKRTKAQLQQAQKMESVGRLAGGVAHDYNNALSVIIGFTEMAIDNVDPAGSLRNDLDEVLKAAKRAENITRQLLAFARKQIIAPEELELNENVESMLKMIRRLIGENIDLAWLPGTGLWSVKMDPSQIDQILANLCVNARDAIEDVGKVTIETENVTFNTAYCADHPGFVPGEFVLLAVSDNGCGMEREILNNIFEPFFTTKDVDKGTGLGLSTVYGIVKQNNGFVNVYSEPGKGTTIKIYLPRHEGKAVMTQRESTVEIPQGHDATILVVEDDLQILKLAEKILAGLGYTVLTAGTPKKALGLAEEHAGEIHLLITDVIMPEMNGHELAQQLQSLYPTVKCIFMSGYTANVIAHHGVLDKGAHFLQKPFSRRDMATIVRKALKIED